MADAITHLRQLDPNGCTIACTAMVTGQSYETVRDEWGHVGKGHDWLKWTTYLVNRGYAVQHLWKHDSERKADRLGWPLPPWTDVHLCAVDAGHGEGSHLVVLLGDGTVLDPATDAPRRWADYPSVLHMTGVVHLAAMTAERDAAVLAFHDAVVRPAGVVPQSGQAIYDPAQAERSERERPRHGCHEDRQERLFAAALAARTGGRADG